MKGFSGFLESHIKIRMEKEGEEEVRSSSSSLDDCVPDRTTSDKMCQFGIEG